MTPLIDYTLRLILNTSDQKISYQNYISGSILLKLLTFLHKNQKNPNIVWSCVQILRILVSTPKACVNFKRALSEHFKQDDPERCFELFLEMLIAAFEANVQTVQIFTDIILFLSYPAKSVDEANNCLMKDRKLVPAIQKYIGHHQADEHVMQLLSECVAYLPIEDLVLHND